MKDCRCTFEAGTDTVLTLFYNELYANNVDGLAEEKTDQAAEIRAVKKS